MIKHIRSATTPLAREEWRNLDEAVEVELTSEDPASPIERALVHHDTNGWRAGTPGPQTISVTWPAPIVIRRIRVVFEEHSQARTQEFVLRATTSDGAREIVRQQFTFSPPGTTVECEEYAVNLESVSRLQLVIVPAIDDAKAVAALRELRIA
jgi:hypothetical protein